MDRLLGTQFGRALYLRRPVRDIMDAAAIVADIGTPLEEIAQLAMARAEPCLYDDLIVTCEGRLSGTVSIPSLLSEMSRAQGALHIAGGVAHELNQPLQVVLGYTEILRQAAEASAFHGSLDTMRSSIERMAAITKRLHDLTADYRTVPYLDGTQIADLRNRTPEDR